MSLSVTRGHFGVVGGEKRTVARFPNTPSLNAPQAFCLLLDVACNIQRRSNPLRKTLSCSRESIQNFDSRSCISRRELLALLREWLWTRFPCSLSIRQRFFCLCTFRCSPWPHPTFCFLHRSAVSSCLAPGHSAACQEHQRLSIQPRVQSRSIALVVAFPFILVILGLVFVSKCSETSTISQQMMNCLNCNSFKRPLHKANYRFYFERTDLTWAGLLLSAESCHCCRVLGQGIEGCLAQHGHIVSDIVKLDILLHYARLDDWTNEDDQDCQKLLALTLPDGKEITIEAFTLPGE